MNTRNVAYWAVTGLVAAAFAMGGAMDLAHGPQVMEGMAKLGYPVYFATILGTWKVLGALAIVLPRFPRLKEWAYAGMFFDLTGAAISHVAVHEVDKVAAPLVLLALVAASWALRSGPRSLAAGAPTVATA
ncbi:MAG: DoxX family protein [Myxococcales bacterium]|nr:DoxX family protein [Myxococcales bacterium]